MSEIRDINSLHEWEKNNDLRIQTEPSFEDTKKNLQYGQHSTLLIRPDGTVIGGNHRLKAMRELGFKEVEVSVLDFGQDEEGFYPILNGRVYKTPDGKIPYHFKTEEQGEIELSFSHNFRGASYNEEGVANIMGSFPEIDWKKFDADFIEPVNLAAWETENTEITEDEIPEVDTQNEPDSKLGEVYQLGRHRLMCGDATKIEDVEKLMAGQKADLVVTDPPYNTGMSGESQGASTLWRGNGKNPGSTRLSHMFNDNFTPEKWQLLINESLANMEVVTKGECAFYVFIDWRNVGVLKEEMEQTLTINNIIVWDKVVHGLGSDYKFTYEMCILGKKGKPQIDNRIGTDYQDIWRVQRTMGRNEDHATAKPLELLKKPILHASKQDDIVLDLFGGSGSTLIASEQTNRTCYMMELDPKYCDVIRKRYAKLIGKEAEWKETTPSIQIAQPENQSKTEPLVLPQNQNPPEEEPQVIVEEIPQIKIKEGFQQPDPLEEALKPLS